MHDVPLKNFCHYCLQLPYLNQNQIAFNLDDFSDGYSLLYDKTDFIALLTKTVEKENPALGKIYYYQFNSQM